MRTALAIILGLAWATAPAASADVVIARTLGATNLTGGAGSLVWSEPEGGNWVLMHYRDGVVTKLPAPPKPDPFDADVGTDRNGKPIVVYTRCVGELQDSCTIRAANLTTDPHDRQVRGLNFRRRAAQTSAPAIYRGAIVYSSRFGDEPFPRLLHRSAYGHIRELSAGGRQAEGGRATIEDTDLGPAGAAFVWRMTGGLLYGVGDVTELRLAPVSGRASVLMDSGLVAEGCGGTWPYAPSVQRDRVDYLTAGVRCSEQTEFTAYDLRDGFRMRAPTPAVATGFVSQGEVFYWLRRNADQSVDVVLSTPVALERGRRVRGTGPYEAAEIPGHRWVRGPLGSRLLRPPRRIDCIPAGGGVLVTIGMQRRTTGGPFFRVVLSGPGVRRGSGHLLNNQLRLDRCGATYRVHYLVSRRAKSRQIRRTFTVRVLST